MRGLSLTQPWASLVANGAKHLETRSWPTSYRGPLAIHASQRIPPEVRAALAEPDMAEWLRRCLGGHWADLALPSGAIVAVCTLDNCRFIHPNVRLVLNDQERAFGNFAPGRWMWRLVDVRRLSRPIPARGALGLWEVPADVALALNGKESVA